jgi:hypothetical protein
VVFSDVCWLSVSMVPWGCEETLIVIAEFILMECASSTVCGDIQYNKFYILICCDTRCSDMYRRMKAIDVTEYFRMV